MATDYSRVLAAVDFAHENSAVIDRAVEIAQRDQVELTILHVVEDLTLYQGEDPSIFDAVLMLRLVKRATRSLTPTSSTVGTRLRSGRRCVDSTALRVIVAASRDHGLERDQDHFVEGRRPLIGGQRGAARDVVADRADRQRLGVVLGRDREDARRLHLDAVDLVFRHRLEHVRVRRVEEIRGEDVADVIAHPVRLRHRLRVLDPAHRGGDEQRGEARVGPRFEAGDHPVLDQAVEESLIAAGLWEEVKDYLDQPGTGLSGGQQQRLCIARAIAVSPEVILMDEPCSALDPIATAKIEELMMELKESYTLVVVTHNMQQASRVSDYTAFLYLGKLIEYQETEKLFINPIMKQTEDYITGRFG